MNDPILTQRLRLDPPSPADLDALADIFAMPEVCTYLGDGSPRSRAHIETSLAKRIDCLAAHGVSIWTVRARVGLPATDTAPAIPAGAVVGDCGVIPVAWHGPEFELLYRLHPHAWGRGIATEAATAACERADRVGINPLIGLAYEGNAASRRVLTRVGFEPRGETDRWYGVTLRWFERVGQWGMGNRQ
ncbi:MAG: GNAT family N-acetyltransferase [Phycisphaerales bacterium]